MTKILLVEDDAHIVTSLTDFLESEGFSVSAAKGQTDALVLFNSDTFDIVLLDIALADGNGFAVCSAIKSRSNTPVIFLTASGDENSTVAGLDIGAAMGTNIFAAAEGTVLVAGWNAGGYGNYVVIDHGGGLTTLYAHCSSLNVSAGQKVSRGQVIAKCGSTGMSTGPHLHFEVLQNGAHTNPSAYLN